MTSRFATNHRFSQQGNVRYLETGSDGQPLQGQVPLTYQVYQGNGNATIDYDGSNVLFIDTALPSGDLTVSFDSMKNFLGRSTKLVVSTQLTNDVILDFGSGWVYTPPTVAPAHDITFANTDSPFAAELVFFDIDKAVLSTNTAASTGGAAPKSLAFKWDTTDTNLNSNTALQVQWTVDAGNNDTSLTLGGGLGAGLCGQFTVTRDTVYSINADCFIVSDPAIAYRAFIGINNDIWCYQESALGLTGQKVSASLTKSLVIGDIIAYYIGNAQGTVTPVNPANVDYGCISITEF